MPRNAPFKEEESDELVVENVHVIMYVRTVLTTKNTDVRT